MPTAGGSGQLDVRIAAKTYRGVTGRPVAALGDVAFRLRRGQVAALVGRSGCGKTTVLRILAGLDPHFDGEVVCSGLGRLGIVFQDPRLLPWRTVEENVQLAREAARLPAGGEEALYAMLGLQDHRGRFPGELSLGLARRAAIARAFAVEPGLLLLDEPFVSLDRPTALRLRGELIHLHERTRPATVLVTHDIEDALAVADIVFVLAGSPGTIVATMPVLPTRAERDPGTLALLASQLAPLLPAG